MQNSVNKSQRHGHTMSEYEIAHDSYMQLKQFTVIYAQSSQQVY